MKKLLALILVAMLLLPCLITGCGKTDKDTETTTETTTGQPEDTPSETEPSETEPGDDPITPPEPAELTLTTINVTTGEDMTEIYAGAELMAYLQKKGIPNTADGFPISIHIDSSLEMDSFKIEASFGENAGMTIVGGNGRGVIYGV